jgi:2-C-methyl-D-erythritol 4-phosphate cytidylyltransferase/2-C-methyl-D-erythritol 2,4-cyclodiphosphate synthase
VDFSRSQPDFAAVVVAAGRSTRFGGSLPKQFLDVGGRPLLERAVRALRERPAVAGVVVVLPADLLEGPDADRVRGWPGVTAVVAGGPARSDSVRRGLRVVPPLPHVLVHDAARPLAGPDLVERVIEATRIHGAAVPCVPIPDTVKRVDSEGRVEATVDRSTLRAAQTPQGARRDWLVEALDRAAAEGAAVTDEAAALERAGRPVQVVAGDPRNVKITTPEDLAVLRDREGEAAMDVRVGTGFDIHRFAEGRRLVLGGTEFEGETGLLGHSDADVVLHAVMDALLGAAGLGDIGVLYPPDDPRFAGADSAGLATDVARRVAAAGFEIVNVDLTVLAERPKIRPKAAAMRESVARCFGLEPGRVGLKATTLEGLGALGRREGIACQAVALLRRRTESA